MSKGRNSTVVSIRLPDDVVYTLQKRVDKQGSASISEYLKQQIIKSCSVNTSGSVNATTIKARLEAQGLNLVGNRIQNVTQSKSSPVKEVSSTRAPLYNRRVHKKGDVVRMPGSNVVVVVPDLDGEGNAVPVW